MENKQMFQVEEEAVAVRSSADRLTREARRARRTFNGTEQHFALDPRIAEELDREGHTCWVNDDLKGHLAYLERVGYRFVTNREAYGEREGLSPEARACVRYGTADDKGTPQDVYLMLQPWEFYREDQEAINEMNDSRDQQIRVGEADVQKGYGRQLEYKTNKT